MCMISRVSSKNKRKRAERKNSVKKQLKDQTEKKRYKETENSVLDHWTTVRRVSWKISFVISKPFFSLPKIWKTLFEAGGAVFIMNSNMYYILGKLA